MKVCIICEGDVEGKAARRVKDDQVIGAIRWMKGALKIARKNELFVCSECQQKHKDRRREFEKMVLYAAIFAGVVLLLLLGRLILAGAFDPVALVSAFVLALFVLSLPLFKYVPAVEPENAEPSPAGASVKSPAIKDEDDAKGGKREVKRKKSG